MNVMSVLLLALELILEDTPNIAYYIAKGPSVGVTITKHS